MAPSLRQTPPLTWELGVSILGHLVLGGTLLAFEALGPPEGDHFKPEEVTWIAAAPPKKKAGLPQAASRRPEPPKGEPTPAEEPPPPKPTEMPLPTEAPPKPKGAEKPTPPEPTPPKTNAARRADLLSNLSAPLGAEEREATDPDGVEGSVAMVGQPGGISDPELVAWNETLKRAIRANWVLPPGGDAWRSSTVTLEVTIDKAGNISGPKVVAKSGDPSFDRSATLAIHKTGRVPPPPAAWADRIALGYQLTMQGGEML